MPTKVTYMVERTLPKNQTDYYAPGSHNGCWTHERSKALPLRTLNEAFRAATLLRDKHCETYPLTITRVIGTHTRGIGTMIEYKPLLTIR